MFGVGCCCFLEAGPFGWHFFLKTSMVMVLYWTAEKTDANFSPLCTVCVAKVI